VVNQGSKCSPSVRNGSSISPKTATGAKHAEHVRKSCHTQRGTATVSAGVERLGRDPPGLGNGAETRDAPPGPAGSGLWAGAGRRGPAGGHTAVTPAVIGAWWHCSASRRAGSLILETNWKTASLTPHWIGGDEAPSTPTALKRPRILAGLQKKEKRDAC